MVKENSKQDSDDYFLTLLGTKEVLEEILEERELYNIIKNKETLELVLPTLKNEGNNKNKV